MEQFINFVKKEFAHVWRDKKTLLILFGMPVIQILIFGFALTNEVKNSEIIVMDQAKDQASQQIISRIAASRYFDIQSSVMDNEQMEAAFKKGKIKMAIVFAAARRCYRQVRAGVLRLPPGFSPGCDIAAP